MRSRFCRQCCLICLSFITIQFSAHATPEDHSSSSDSIDPNTEQNRLPLDELRAFANIFGRIKQDYVEEIDDLTLIEYAIRGMLTRLDPHSTYLVNDALKDFKEDTRGEFGGLGIEIGTDEGVIKVISPIDDTPADKAGIKAGDLIIKLGNQPVKNMPLNKAVDMMRGKPGTEITLTILRKGKKSPLEITVKRAIIPVTSIKSKELEAGFAYIRISQFQARTIDEMLEAINQLKKQNPIKGLVLDLRNNPGGLLNAAVSVSDAFLSEGLIVYTKGRAADSEYEFKAAPDDVMTGAPIVVLVNGGSASASEIVAGALQDNKRAIIMGEQTFGKGSVQTILNISETTAIKLTTARYFTPSGRSIQAEGITPNIILKQLNLAKGQDDTIRRYKEADLPGHLAHKDDSKKNKSATKQQKEPKKSDFSLAERDFQLYEALNLLKGLTLLKSD